MTTDDRGYDELIDRLEAEAQARPAPDPERYAVQTAAFRGALAALKAEWELARATLVMRGFDMLTVSPAVRVRTPTFVGEDHRYRATFHLSEEGGSGRWWMEITVKGDTFQAAGSAGGDHLREREFGSAREAVRYVLGVIYPYLRDRRHPGTAAG